MSNQTNDILQATSTVQRVINARNNAAQAAIDKLKQEIKAQENKLVPAVQPANGQSSVNVPASKGNVGTNSALKSGTGL